MLLLRQAGLVFGSLESHLAMILTCYTLVEPFVIFPLTTVSAILLNIFHAYGGSFPDEILLLTLHSSRVFLLCHCWSALTHHLLTITSACRVADL